MGSRNGDYTSPASSFSLANSTSTPANASVTYIPTTLRVAFCTATVTTARHRLRPHSDAGIDRSSRFMEEGRRGSFFVVHSRGRSRRSTGCGTYRFNNLNRGQSQGILSSFAERTPMMRVGRCGSSRLHDSIVQRQDQRRTLLLPDCLYVQVHLEVGSRVERRGLLLWTGNGVDLHS